MLQMSLNHLEMNFAFQSIFQTLAGSSQRNFRRFD